MYRFDPLRKRIPRNTEELVNRFATAADGVTADMLIGASMTMFLSALRNTHRNRAKVEERFNDLVGQARQVLLDHYDGTTGKLKETFALVDPTTNKPITIKKSS